MRLGKYQHEILKRIHLRWTVTLRYNLFSRTNHFPPPRKYITIQIKCEVFTLPDPNMTTKRSVRRIHLVTLAELCVRTACPFCRCHAFFFRSNLLFTTDLRLNILFRMVIDKVWHFTGIDVRHSDREIFGAI